MNPKHSSPPQSKQGKLYYGWIIIIASFFICLVAFGIQHSFGIFLKPLQDEFGWSGALTSGAFSVYFIVHGLVAVPAGWVTDRFGPKTTILTGSLLLGGGLLLTSRTNLPWQLYLSYGLFVGAGVGSVWCPLTATASRWFLEKRGLALGILSSGIGVGMLIMSPVAGWLISVFGWRISYFIIGLGVWVIIIPSAMFLVREPRDKKLLPYGAVASEVRGDFDAMAGLTLQQALQTRTLWLLFFMYALCTLCIQTVIVHVVRYAITVGIPPLSAAKVLSFVGGFSVAGKLTVGSVSDLVGRRKTFVASALIQIIAVLCLIRATSISTFYLVGSVFGFSYGGFAPLVVMLTGEFLGLHSLGANLGVIMLGSSIGGAIGPVLAGRIFDITGSYAIALISAASSMLLATILSLGLKVAFPMDRKPT